MSEVERVRKYFVKSAVSFDSLYSESESNPVMRFINQKLRRDIYERFIMTMDHVRKYDLKTALDVGCGSGRYAAALAQNGLDRITGVDLSQSMIELAEHNVKQSNGTKAKFEFTCGDFMEFQKEETSDVVLAMGFFDYINDPVPVLEKMKSLANHSVIASFPSISFYRTPIRKVRYHIKKCPVYFFSEEDIKGYSERAGFSKCEIVKIKGAGMDYFVTFYK